MKRIDYVIDNIEKLREKMIEKTCVDDFIGCGDSAECYNKGLSCEDCWNKEIEIPEVLVKFKVGDKVKCIDDYGVREFIKMDETYNVSGIKDRYIRVNGSSRSFNSNRFVKVEEEKKIEDLVKLMNENIGKFVFNGTENYVDRTHINTNEEVMPIKTITMVEEKIENAIKNENTEIKPSRYNAGSFDVIEFCLKNKIEFWAGRVIECVARASKKDKSNEIEDLNEAIEYIQRRIKFLEENN